MPRSVTCRMGTRKARETPGGEGSLVESEYRKGPGGALIARVGGGQFDAVRRAHTQNPAKPKPRTERERPNRRERTPKPEKIKRHKSSHFSRPIFWIYDSPIFGQSPYLSLVPTSPMTRRIIMGCASPGAVAWRLKPELKSDFLCDKKRKLHPSGWPEWASEGGNPWPKQQKTQF